LFFYGGVGENVSRETMLIQEKVKKRIEKE